VSDRKVRLLLFLAIFIVSALPLLAALYFLDSTLKTSLSLGFNAQVTQALEDGAENLKTLRTLDPERQAAYRQQFESLQQLQQVYSDPEMIRRGILDSLRIYFAIGFIAAVVVSVFVAVLLSRKIARAYKQTFEELIAQREKVRYLQEISSWQELAKVLAHEIKNPLTPIEVLVSSLDKSHRTLNSTEFAQHLLRTQVMIAEELQHLKRTVNKFADFARLPAVQLTRVDLRDALSRILQALTVQLEPAQIDVRFVEAAPVEVELDSTLFRQVLTNIVRNGIEANPQQRVQFSVVMSLQNASVEIAVDNDGVPVPAELSERIFDPYVSTKRAGDNMGLGLAIVRKIVIEHGGDIRYEERHGRPTFVITLPRVRR
jgi:signal transduction histidine kinase